MPVCTEPVKPMRQIRGWRTSASPVGSPVPCTYIDEPGRQHLRQISPMSVPDKRAGLRRLDDDGVAGHQRRGQVRGGEQERVIEWHDARHHAIGFAQREVHPVGRCRHAVALHLGAEAGEEVEVVGGHVDIAAEAGDGVARVGGFERQDLADCAPAWRPRACARVAPLPDRARRPGRLGRLGGLHGALHVLARCRPAPGRATSSVAGLTDSIHSPPPPGTNCPPMYIRRSPNLRLTARLRFRVRGHCGDAGPACAGAADRCARPSGCDARGIGLHATRRRRS